MSKKLLALLLALVMIVGSFTSVLADPVKTEEKKEEPAKTEEKKDEKSEEKKDEKSEEKKDEKSEEKTEEKKEEVKDEALLRAIEVLKKAGFISGFSKDSEDFRTEQNVTRAQFASMIVRAKGLEDSAKALANLPTGFKDVPANGWANGYIAVAKQQGFVNGYPNGTFRPDAQVSYQDMATMLTIALGQAEAGTVYPAGYIVKAQQLGLFKNVDVPAYTDMATRGNVFKMLYNMITSKEFGERKILKAIVLENSRLEKIAADEVVVEVIKVVQQANWVGANRDKRGDQHKYKLDKDLKLDAEDMLGKVYDITVDKNDKIVEVKLDDSYDYLDGRITSVDPKKFGVNWTKYTAELNERYDDTDERIFRTYLNNKDYKYADFADKYRKEVKDSDYYYTRVTVKNSKVVFIDAYKFKDIAPVESVKDGSVWYYDDERNASVVKANDLESVVFNTAKGYSVGDLKEIVKDDVIHLYDDYRDYHNTHAIVKKDARIDTELTKTTLLENRSEYAVDKDGKYKFNRAIPFRPVYSYEGKQFEVVTSRELLQPIVGRKVKMLVAIDGTLQLIESDLQWNDGINAIRRITSSGDVLLVPSKGDTFWAKEDRDTRYYSWIKKDNNKQLSQLFGLNDVVYFEGRGSEKDQTIARMVRVFKHIPATYSTDYKSINTVIKPNMFEGVRYNAKGNYYTDTFKFATATINSRYIALDKAVAKEKYRYFDNLHAYYLDAHDNLRQINDIERFVADNKENEDLQAVVYTEKDLKLLLENYFDVRTYHFLSLSNTIANTVIFDFAKNTADADVVFATVIGKDNWTDTVFFRDANDKEFAVKLNDEFGEGKNHTKYGIGDIVKLHILKATADKDVKEGFVEKVAIKWNAPKLPIKEIRELKEYKIGNAEHKFFDKDTVIFERLAGYYAQVYYENEDVDKGDEDVVRVIRFWERPDVRNNETEFTFLDESSKRTNGRLLIVHDEDGKETSIEVNPQTRFANNDLSESTFGIGNNAINAFVDKYGQNASLKLTFENGMLAEVKALEKEADRAKRVTEEVIKAIKEEIEKIEVFGIEEKDTAKIATEYEKKVKEKLDSLELQKFVNKKAKEIGYGVSIEYNKAGKCYAIPSVTPPTGLKVADIYTNLRVIAAREATTLADISANNGVAIKAAKNKFYIVHNADVVKAIVEKADEAYKNLSNKNINALDSTGAVVETAVANKISELVNNTVTLVFVYTNADGTTTPINVVVNLTGTITTNSGSAVTADTYEVTVSYNGVAESTKLPLQLVK